jgi:hypothetical protein
MKQTNLIIAFLMDSAWCTQIIMVIAAQETMNEQLDKHKLFAQDFSDIWAFAFVALSDSKATDMLCRSDV